MFEQLTYAGWKRVEGWMRWSSGGSGTTLLELTPMSLTRLPLQSPKKPVTDAVSCDVPAGSPPRPRR